MNAVLNYLLIYTAGLGVTGAAIASAVSYVAGGSLMFAAYWKNPYLCWRKQQFRLNGEILKEGATLALPVLGTSLVSCMGYVVFAGMVSGMGTTTFAAHSIAVSAEEIFYIPGFGLRTATSALVGISLGENNRKKFEVVSIESILLTVFNMFLSGITLYIVAFPLMCIFTSSRNVAALGAEMLRLVAFSEPFFGLMIVMEGIFYGLGRTRYAFFVEAFSMWGIRIAFTFLCVQVMHLGLRQVWYCMIADNICKAVLLSLPMAVRRRRRALFPASRRRGDDI